MAASVVIIGDTIVVATFVTAAIAFAT